MARVKDDRYLRLKALLPKVALRRTFFNESSSYLAFKVKERALCFEMLPLLLMDV